MRGFLILVVVCCLLPVVGPALFFALVGMKEVILG